MNIGIKSITTISTPSTLVNFLEHPQEHNYYTNTKQFQTHPRTTKPKLKNPKTLLNTLTYKNILQIHNEDLWGNLDDLSQ